MYKRHSHRRLGDCIKDLKNDTENHHLVINDILWGFISKSRKGRKFLREYKFLVEV